MTLEQRSHPAADGVRCSVLSDGILVQLVGALTDDLAAQQLRDVLLRPLPAQCQDVIVDAQGLTEVDDTVLAVLIAAAQWVRGNRRRFALSASSPALAAALGDATLEALLPRLPRLGRR